MLIMEEVRFNTTTKFKGFVFDSIILNSILLSLTHFYINVDQVGFLKTIF